MRGRRLRLALGTEQRTLTYVLSAICLIVSMTFVYRSFYGMRIGSEADREVVSNVEGERAIVEK